MARQQKGTAIAEATRKRIPNRELPIDCLDDHPENYNDHPDEQIHDLEASLDTWGQVQSITVWDRGNGRYTIVGGHGVVEAARREGETIIKADVLPPQTSPEDIEGIMAALNEHARHSVPDEPKLAALLERQRNVGVNLHALGSSEDALSALQERLAQEVLRRAEQAEHDEDEYGASPDDGDEDDAGSPPNSLNPQDQDGVLLERLRLALVEPQHRVAPGDVWQLGGRHLLVCADPLREWAYYFPYLEQQQEAADEDAAAGVSAKPHPVIFAPFAGPFLCLGRRAHRRRYVLVQPDPYIAGHVLSVYTQVHGEDAVQCIASGDEGLED